MQKPVHALIYPIHTSPSKDAFHWSLGTTKAVERWANWFFHPKNQKIKKELSGWEMQLFLLCFHPSIFLSLYGIFFFLTFSCQIWLSIDVNTGFPDKKAYMYSSRAVAERQCSLPLQHPGILLEHLAIFFTFLTEDYNRYRLVATSGSEATSVSNGWTIICIIPKALVERFALQGQQSYVMQISIASTNKCHIRSIVYDM